MDRPVKKKMNRLRAYRVTGNESYFKWGGGGIEIPSQEGEVKGWEKGISGRRKHQNIKGGKD